MISKQLIIPDRTARMQRAKEVWRASPGSASEKLTDSLLGDVLRVALDDFAVTYKSMRGHELDPVYWTAVRYDILIAIEAAIKAGDGEGRVPSSTTGDGQAPGIVKKNLPTGRDGEQ